MKMNRLFLMALAAGMMASCSDEATAPETSVRPSQGETGYIALSINMPQTSGSGTRANDSFNDGIPAEYQANDATLILFTGDSESEATVKGVYDMGKPVPQAEGGNITVKYNTVQQITNPASGTEKLYAMVVLNNSGLIKVSGTDGAESTLNGQKMTSMNFTHFTAATANYLLTDANLSAIANVSGSNFLMSNAPLSTAVGGSTAPSNPIINTLVEVNQNNIYPSKSAAQNGEATTITVERAVAKVTVKNGATGATADDKKITSFNIDGWTLCNTNKKSYFTRNVDCGSPAWWGYKNGESSVTDYRFIGSDDVYTTTGTPSVSYYRTYWAKDPNYSTHSDDDLNVVTGIPTSWNDLDKDAYCLENTFNVANQNQNQTTGVIVKATLTVTGAESASDKSFFTLNGDRSTIYTFAKMLEKTKEFYLENASVKAACEDASTGLLSGQQLEASDLVVELTNSDNQTKVSLDGTDDAISDFTKAGNYTLTSIYVKDASASKFKSGVPEALKSTNATLIETIKNNVGTVSYYKNGEAYYYVLIRHFDETQTPWDPEKLEAAKLSGSYPNSYQSKTAEENWLGRYGVVRNNWYQVNVTGIAQIGDAEAPVIPGKPDDTREQWIKAEINVLSWAVRTQDAVLGDKW